MVTPRWDQDPCSWNRSVSDFYRSCFCLGVMFIRWYCCWRNVWSPTGVKSVGFIMLHPWCELLECIVSHRWRQRLWPLGPVPRWSVSIPCQVGRGPERNAHHLLQRSLVSTFCCVQLINCHCWHTTVTQSAQPAQVGTVLAANELSDCILNGVCRICQL